VIEPAVRLCKRDGGLGCFSLSDHRCDPDDLYIPIILLADLIVATLAYFAIVKLWRHYWG
jgi:hypothetical protein